MMFALHTTSQGWDYNTLMYYICVGSYAGIIVGSSTSCGCISRVVVALFICHVYLMYCPHYLLLHVMSFLYILVPCS